MPASPLVTLLPITIAHSEVKGSPRESISSEGKFSAERVLRCKWTERFLLADQLLHAYEVLAGGLLVVYGRPYPYNASAYAKSISFENWAGNAKPIAGDTTLASYEWAHLNVHYEQSPANPNSAQIAEESLSTLGQFMMTTDPTKLYLQGKTDPIEPGAVPTKYMPMTGWNYTLNQVKTLPPGWIQYKGYVNSSPIISTSLGMTFDAETLLYDGVEPSRTILASGAQAWRAPLKFLHRPGGWNKYPDSAGTLLEIHTAPSATPGSGTQRKIYPSTDFLTSLNVIV